MVGGGGGVICGRCCDCEYEGIIFGSDEGNGLLD